MEREKLVFIKHSGSGLFLFCVPSELDLFAGDRVVCDTKYGHVSGMCICDSFYTYAGGEIRKAAGVPFNAILKSVIKFDGRFPQNSEAIINAEINLKIDDIF